MHLSLSLFSLFILCFTLCSAKWVAVESYEYSTCSSYSFEGALFFEEGKCTEFYNTNTNRDIWVKFSTTASTTTMYTCTQSGCNSCTQNTQINGFCSSGAVMKVYDEFPTTYSGKFAIAYTGSSCSRSDLNFVLLQADNSDCYDVDQCIKNEDGGGEGYFKMYCSTPSSLIGDDGTGDGGVSGGIVALICIIVIGGVVGCCVGCICLIRRSRSKSHCHTPTSYPPSYPPPHNVAYAVPPQQQNVGYVPNVQYAPQNNQYPPQNNNQYPPQNNNQYPPQNNNQYPPQNTNQYPPQNNNQYPPQNNNQYPPQNDAAQYPPQNEAAQYPPPAPQNTEKDLLL